LFNEVLTENRDDVTSPYNTFKYAVRTELTRKYYERRLRTFFDFIGFLTGSELKERCNTFAEKGKKDSNWAAVHIIKFLQYEKERVEKTEITAATSQKVFNKLLWMLKFRGHRYENGKLLDYWDLELEK
jgi:hypothetical protein